MPTASFALALADLGGMLGQVHAPPMGLIPLFSHTFSPKMPTSEVHTPLKGAHPPMGNPGSATA